jgi:uncharacterized membrane-anchored protein YhcB (DUF1043 family)
MFIGIILFIVGTAIGVVANRFLFGNRHYHKELQAKLAATEAESHQYKQQVALHFEKTADLINTLTQNYQAVYAQFAKDARVLCHEDVLATVLAPKEVLETTHEPHNPLINKLRRPRAEPTLPIDHAYSENHALSTEIGVPKDYALEDSEEPIVILRDKHRD